MNEALWDMSVDAFGEEILVGHSSKKPYEVLGIWDCDPIDFDLDAGVSFRGKNPKVTFMKKSLKEELQTGAKITRQGVPYKVLSIVTTDYGAECELHEI